MKCLMLLYFLLLMHVPFHAFTQQTIRLQKITNQRKIKVLDLEREYNIKAINNISYSKIFGITDSSLLLIGQVPTGKDTVLVQKYFSRPPDSTTIQLTLTDTINISFNNIQYIRRD